MPNNVDSVIANEALQQTSAPPCSPRLYYYFFSTFATGYKTPCYKWLYGPERFPGGFQKQTPGIIYRFREA